MYEDVSELDQASPPQFGPVAGLFLHPENGATLSVNHQAIATATGRIGS